MKAILLPMMLAVLLFAPVFAEPAKESFVIYRIKGKFAEVPVVLKDEYAIMLINDRVDGIPKARYIFAQLSKRELVDTRDIKEFKAAIASIPKGAEVFEYDSCTVPRWYGLSEDDLNCFFSALEDASIELSDERRLTCYCKGMGG